MGAEFADHLFTSVPLILRRQMGNMIGAMLRPRTTPWSRTESDNDRLNDTDEANR